MMLTRFILGYYLKYFFIVLFALELFFVGVDSLKYVGEFPQSANLVILFVFYNAMYALNYTFPISLILSFVVFFILMIKSNQFTALLALGFSRFRIIRPILGLIVVLILGFCGLNTTSFVYAQENAQNIISDNALINTSENLLVKYNNDFVYFEKIYPLLKTANNIKIFSLDGDGLVRDLVQASGAQFKNNAWHLIDAKVSIFPQEFVLNKTKLKIEHHKELKILEGFKPKILDTIYQSNQSVSIVDAILSLKILLSQNADSTKVRAFLYSLIVVPFFVPLVCIIIAFYVPTLARYSNLALLSFLFIIFSLCAWGIFFVASKLSVIGLLNPELGLLLPFVILFVVSSRYLFRINS